MWNFFSEFSEFNVNYTKCVKNTLEKQHKPKYKPKSVSDYSSKNFKQSGKDIKAIDKISEKEISHTSPDKVAEKSDGTSTTTPFSQNLVFRVPIDKAENSKKTEKLHSSISCKKRRKYYEKKDKEKH